MLPKASFVTLEPRALRIPSPRDPGVTAWRDRRGRLGALSHEARGEFWLHVLGVASFRLDLHRDRVVAIPTRGVSQEAVEDEYLRTVWPVVLQLRGWEVLHASAIRIGDAVVAFCAPSETGKSTLAYGFAQRGHGLWADDAVVLEIGPESIQTAQLSFQPRLRPASADYYRDRADTREPLPAGTATSLRPSGPLPVTAICLLSRDPDVKPAESADAPPVEIEALAGAAAVPLLLEHAIYFSFGDRERKRRMIENYLQLARLVPIYRVSIRSGFEHLPSVLDTLERELHRP